MQGDEDYDEEDEEGEGGPTYEELIELGQQIGDVKAERYCGRGHGGGGYWWTPSLLREGPWGVLGASSI